MRSVTLSISGLLAGVFLLMVGAGLLSTLVPVRLGAAGASSPVIGAVSGGYFAGLVVGGLIAHRLISTVGHIRSFATFASLMAAAALVHPLWPSVLAWGGLRVLAGLCMAGLFMCIESWLNEQASDRTRGRILSVYMVVVYIAQGGGQLLLPLPDGSGYVLFVLASVLVSLAVIAVAAVPVRGPRRPRPMHVSLGRLVAVSPVAITGALASGLVLGAFYGLAPLFTQRIGMPLDETATFMGAAIVGGVLLQWPLGWVSDRIERRIVLAAVATLVAAVAIAIAFVSTPRPDLLIFLAPLLGGVIFTIYPLSVAQANDRIDRRERVAVSGGLIIVYGCGAAVGPLLGAWAMSVHGPSGLFMFIAAASVLLATLSLVRRVQRAPVPADSKLPFQVVPRTTAVAGALDPRTLPTAPATGGPGPVAPSNGR